MTTPIINSTAVPVPAKVPPLDVTILFRLVTWDDGSWKWVIHSHNMLGSSLGKTESGDLIARIADHPQPDNRDARIKALREAMKFVLRNTNQTAIAGCACDALADDDAAAGKESK